MLYRIRQFVQGIMAKGPDAEEAGFIEAVLSPPARALFYGMHRTDQRHCLNVWHTARALWQQGSQGRDAPNDIEKIKNREKAIAKTKLTSRKEAGGSGKAGEDPLRLLARCCLLHDVGRGAFMGNKTVTKNLNKSV